MLSQSKGEVLHALIIGAVVYRDYTESILVITGFISCEEVLQIMQLL
jgi:hypothetical protein